MSKAGGDRCSMSDVLSQQLESFTCSSAAELTQDTLTLLASRLESTYQVRVCDVEIVKIIVLKDGSE